VSTKAITGYRHVADKEGKVKLVRKPPRMAPVLASAKHKQAARIEKRLRQNAAKSKGDTT